MNRIDLKLIKVKT